MAGTSNVVIIAESLASAVEPLEFALRSPETFESFMLRLGWNTSTYIASVQNLGGIATNLLQLAGDGLDPADASRAIGLLVQFFDAVQSLSSTTVLPETIDAAEFAADFPQQLTDYLMANYLLTQRPLLGAMLLAGGVITRAQKPAQGKRPPYERLDVAWGSVGNLLHDALSTVRNAYGWGTPAFAQQSFIDNMVALGEALGCAVFSHSISAELKDVLNQGATSTTSRQDGNVRWRIVGTSLSPAAVECGIDLFILPATATAQTGIAVSPYAKGFADAAFEITDSLSIDLKAGFDISKGVLVSIRPGQEVTVKSDLLSSDPATVGEFAATFQLRGDAGAKIIILGSEGGSRFEYGSLSLTLGARTDKHGPSFYAEAAVIDGAIVIAPGADADGFIAALLPSDITIDAGLTVGFDSIRGAYFGGSAGFEIEIPAHIRLGPLEIISATISSKPSGEALPVALGATFRGSFGPFTAEIENIGLIVDLSFPGKGGNIGPVNAALKYRPPDGVGLVVDAPVVIGGGFLRFDAEKEEYSGILQLEIAETIAVKAIGLLSTRMPGGGKGYSLMVIITAEGFAPIQLGYGFTLTGIGGLLAINRTFNEEALRAGLKNHTLDSVMFPKDPIRNAPQILSNLNKVFPPANGHHLFGPMVQISWGTPTLITVDLAVVLEFGARLRLLILAQVVAILPKRENDLVRLQMDAIGVIDFDQGTAALDATLYDSRLLKKFVMTGDMAMRMKWEGSPNFALAIGGLHPAFNPPANFPKLQRIAINLSAGDNPRIRCEAYFALTSNTVQFGARAELYAAAAGFSIHGGIGYDVLIQLDPFQFLAEFYAQVQLKRGSSNLFKVKVEGALAGPRPLHVKAKATFEILWWDVSIRIDKTLVAGEKPPLPDPMDVLPRLKEALGHAGNWVGQLPNGQRPMVTLREKPRAANEVLLHPLGTLTVKQSIVPLDIDIARFGQAAPAGARRFTISSVSLGEHSQTIDPVKEFFAPAQFFEMSDDEKLSRPSFEPMAAGVSIGSQEFAFTSDDNDWLEVEAIKFETIIMNKEKKELRRDPKKLYQLSAELFGKQSRFGAAGASAIRRSGKAKYRAAVGKHRIAKEGWSIVATDSLTVEPVPGIEGGKPVIYSEAAQALTKLKHQDPAKAAGLKILRLSELS